MHFHEKFFFFYHCKHNITINDHKKDITSKEKKRFQQEAEMQERKVKKLVNIQVNLKYFL